MATHHGPGQVVGYLVADVRGRGPADTAGSRRGTAPSAEEVRGAVATELGATGHEP